MARLSKAKKTRGQKAFKDTVEVAADDTTAVAGAPATFDEPTIGPSSIEDSKCSVRTSSINAQETAIDATKPRADSISPMELNDMATKQLLAELESTMASPRRVRTSV